MHRWGFSTTLEAQGRAQIYVDDRNSDAAAGYWVANLRAGFEQETRHWRFSEFARLDNLADRAYVGSVIVNESQFAVLRAGTGPNGLHYVQCGTAELSWCYVHQTPRTALYRLGSISSEY